MESGHFIGQFIDGFFCQTPFLKLAVQHPQLVELLHFDGIFESVSRLPKAGIFWRSSERDNRQIDVWSRSAC